VYYRLKAVVALSYTVNFIVIAICSLWLYPERDGLYLINGGGVFLDLSWPYIRSLPHTTDTGTWSAAYVLRCVQDVWRARRRVAGDPVPAAPQQHNALVVVVFASGRLYDYRPVNNSYAYDHLLHQRGRASTTRWRADNSNRASNWQRAGGLRFAVGPRRAETGVVVGPRVNKSTQHFIGI
jgi:hypothetical protein